MGERTDITSGMGMTSAESGDREPEEIRADIEKTRASIGETVSIIQERLAPERLKQEAQEKVREATIGRIETMAQDVGYKATQVRHTMMDTIRANPVPAALVGLGLGWLIMEGWKSSRELSSWPETEARYYPVEDRYAGRYQPGDQYRSRSAVRETFDTAQDKASEMADRARETADQVRHQAQELGSQVSDKASQITSQVSDKAGQITGQVADKASQLTETARDQAAYISDQAQYQVQRAKGQFEQIMQSNPLIVGAAAMAVGMAVGFSLPETEYEDRLMGETRDNLMDKAQAVTEDTMHKVQNVAQEAGRTVQEEAERQNLTSPSGQM